MDGERSAVITAGGRIDGPFALAAGTTVKALVPLGDGRLMIDAAIDAARGANIEKIAVVGGAEVRRHCSARVDAVLDESADGAVNVATALSAWPAGTIVYLTSDLPFIDGPGLARFCAAAENTALAMALAAAPAYEARFPGAPPHVMRLGRERFANGSVFVFDAAVAGKLRTVATRAFAARKNLLRLAGLLGPRLLVQFALRRLSIAAIEERAHALLGARVAAIRGAAPELCYDVDNLAEWTYAYNRLKM